MHDAIYAQPGALRLATRGQDDALEGAAARIRLMERVLLAGIGTSWHAALVGELLLAHAGRLGHRARAFQSFELASYWPEPDARTALVVVSHRGSKRSSLEALARARAAGGTGIAVTGKGADGLAAADFTLRTVEQEASGCHTVSYTCALWLLATLAARVGADEALAHDLEELPDLLATLLGQEAWEELAARFAGRPRYWFVGGGPNTATAYEGALKLAEAGHATALGLECEQFLHGPWAALEPDDVVVLIAPPGPSRARCLDVARAVHAVGAPLVALAPEDDRELAGLAAETIALPPVPELLSPILAVVPLQLLAYHLAVHRGANPDTLRADQPAHARARAAFTL
jgi:glucosamine--fructose-6-phosphate aminotransferase (isomerizing)